MEYKYSFYTRYKYGINGSDLKYNTNSSCFSEIFYHTGKINTFEIEIYMYNDGVSAHNILALNKDDILYVFDRLSEVINIPILEEFTDVYGGGLCLKLFFESKSAGYIKTILTICRYFFEKTSARRDFNEIISGTIKYAKKHEEIPFIEVFQLFHYDLDINTNHSLVEGFSNEYPVKIISNSIFILRMNDSNVLSVNNKRSNGVFAEFEHDEGNIKEKYLDNLDKIIRV